MSTWTDTMPPDDGLPPVELYMDEPLANATRRKPITIDGECDSSEEQPTADPEHDAGPDKPANGGQSKHGYGAGRFELREDGNGVYYVETDKDGNAHDTWICGPLHVTAKTRDGTSNEWGRLLEWCDDDGQPHQWAMPSALLQGDGIEVRRELATGGLHIAPSGKARNLLTAYIQTTPVNVRARCVKRLGWHGSAYVTSNTVYGDATKERPVFQSESAVLPENSATGTVDDWRDKVAKLASGNTRLVFAISIALAGPLLELAGEDSGGFHYRGSSSTGKTTALRLAASVYGEPNRYVRTWRATTNGLEGTAAIHNDGLLILDEIHQADPLEAAEAAYMLANGQGKARASRTGSAREALTWRLLFLSSGEQSLAARLASIGKKATAGQEVRLADIPADAGRGMGVVEELHGLPSSGDLVAALAEGIATAHGTVGREWLALVARDRPGLASELRSNLDVVAHEITDGTDSGGQAFRVARRFALAAVAGDLATRYGLTGWRDTEALDAARTCYAAWLAEFGQGGNREERDLLQQVRAFLEAHGASRFESASGDDTITRDRVGFTRSDGNGGTEYLVLPEQFRCEIVKGHDPKWAAKVLAEHDWLLVQGGRNTCVEHIPAHGSGSVRVYVLTAKAAGGAE
jgi:uncharacterized protein (DUF927 family)